LSLPIAYIITKFNKYGKKIVIGVWYDDGFGFSDLDRIMFSAKFSDQDRIRIPLKFFGADRIIKFQYPHNTGRLWGSESLEAVTERRKEFFLIIVQV